MVGPERTQVSDNAPGVSRTTAMRATFAGVVTRNGSGVRVSGCLRRGEKGGDEKQHARDFQSSLRLTANKFKKYRADDKISAGSEKDQESRT